MMMKATMKDIASLANVSVSTVSYVLVIRLEPL
jgi:DNA-binding MurR/RpiR family transcriptional regulator